VGENVKWIKMPEEKKCRKYCVKIRA